MRKKERLCIDYLITPFMGIFVINGQQINLVSSEGTKKFSVHTPTVETSEVSLGFSKKI